MNTLECHCEYWHNNPPAPFNPHYDPAALERGHYVMYAMEAEGFYANHTREECAAELALREDMAKEIYARLDAYSFKFFVGLSRQQWTRKLKNFLTKSGSRSHKLASRKRS